MKMVSLFGHMDGIKNHLPESIYWVTTIFLSFMTYLWHSMSVFCNADMHFFSPCILVSLTLISEVMFLCSLNTS